MKTLFHTKAWQRDVGMWSGLIALVYGVYLVVTDEVSWVWLLVSYLILQWSMICISVGYHRLFTHSAFKCSQFWKYAFCITGSAFLNASPLQWAYLHVWHHKYSDTDQDPHDIGLKIFRWNYKPIDYPIPPMTKKMMRDKMHVFFHRYSLLVSLTVGLLCAIMSWKLFLYCFMIPMGYTLLSVSMFLGYSHIGGHARNLFWVDFIFPFCGEWVHEAHHKTNPRALNNAVKPWEFDIGYLFIRLIQK